jgi:hypothetical protein
MFRLVGVMIRVQQVGNGDGDGGFHLDNGLKQEAADLLPKQGGRVDALAAVPHKGSAVTR